MRHRRGRCQRQLQSSDWLLHASTVVDGIRGLSTTGEFVSSTPEGGRSRGAACARVYLQPATMEDTSTYRKMLHGKRSFGMAKHLPIDSPAYDASEGEFPPAFFFLQR